MIHQGDEVYASFRKRIEAVEEHLCGVHGKKGKFFVNRKWHNRKGAFNAFNYACRLLRIV